MNLEFIEKLTAEQILKMTAPEELYRTPEESIARNDFHSLAIRWHPDRCKHPEAASVFSHINDLHEKVQEKIKKGTWHKPGLFRAELLHGSGAGSWMEVEYKRQYRFESGDAYISHDRVLYVLDDGKLDFFKAFEAVTSSFKFASPSMEKEVSKYLPKRATLERLKDGRFAIEIPKTKDLLRLRDVLEFYKGDIGERHVAWVISSLCNLCCYLNFAKLSHNDISLDTYYISPEFHSGALLGGWWFWQNAGGPLRLLPRRTFEHLPWDVRRKKKASVKTDMELVRLVGLELLGSKIDSVPTSVKQWLNSVAPDSAIEDYESWTNAIVKGYGPKKFIKMEVDSEAVLSR